jgi:glucose-6-phosphate dehydrogenase assembly protein OpcA
MPAVSDSVWSAQDTTPGAIEAALRGLLAERHAADERDVPARALNLVCVVDKAWSGEVANRLRGVGRYHASRTVVCAVEPGRTHLDARATIAGESEPDDGTPSALRETVVIDVGTTHLEHLESIVDPLVVTDLATVVWSPHGHPEAVDALLELAQVVLLDSVDEPDVQAALRRVGELSDSAYVVDLAWLRSTPWRERVAAAFDPPSRRDDLRTLAKVSVRHREDSTVSGLLLLGWLCSRLGWRPEAMTRQGALLRGRARGRRGEVELRLEPVGDMTVPGLAGVELTTASGTGLNLARGAGGLRAQRKEADGRVAEWTVLGASRGEAGILGEGIRQALLRDPTHRPALHAALGLL